MAEADHRQGRRQQDHPVLASPALLALRDSRAVKLWNHPEFSAVLRSGRIFAWYWGHEHRCSVFEGPDKNFGILARCIGNSGMPDSRDPRAICRRRANRSTTAPSGGAAQAQTKEGNLLPDVVVLEGPNEYIKGEEDKFSPHGYAVLNLDGPSLDRAGPQPEGTGHLRKEAGLAPWRSADASSSCATGPRARSEQHQVADAVAKVRAIIGPANIPDSEPLAQSALDKLHNGDSPSAEELTALEIVVRLLRPVVLRARRRAHRSAGSGRPQPVSARPEGQVEVVLRAGQTGAAVDRPGRDQRPSSTSAPDSSSPTGCSRPTVTCSAR